MTSELESVINHEVREAGERILEEYQQKLLKIDQAEGDVQLDFNTVDLIRGALTSIREHAESWGTEDFVTQTVEEIGEVSYETRVYHEKVGEKEEEVIVGSHEEQIGTRKVKTGSHREKVGTRTVKNPQKRWWKLFTPRFVEEDIYESVDDYKDEAVYKTVLDYKTVIRDIYEERSETIEKFSVQISDIQANLVGILRQDLSTGIENALEHAEDQIDSMKDQFTNMFAKLDDLILEKYQELEDCAKDQKLKEEELERNKNILSWIEANVAEIHQVLEI